MLPGVFKATKKDGSVYYRSSITHKRKHISLGSFNTEEAAFNAYLLGTQILEGNEYTIDSNLDGLALPFDKCICLINYRDNDLYFKTPIYVRQNYFQYFYSPTIDFKFDLDDLFFYSTRTIQSRKGHFFVADYGTQYTILSRYGIRAYAVRGRDFEFKNGDEYDYRRANIVLLNSFYGVTKVMHKNKAFYRSEINIVGNHVLGYFETPIRAAVAYNKAVDEIKKAGIEKEYNINFTDELTPREYATTYYTINLPNKFLRYLSDYKKKNSVKQ